MTRKSPRICDAGHRYYKTSSCPVCPICESGRELGGGFPPTLSAPARRALEGAGIKTLAQLSKWSEEGLLELHGLGPSSIPKLRDALARRGLSFRD